MCGKRCEQALGLADVKGIKMSRQRRSAPEFVVFFTESGREGENSMTEEPAAEQKSDIFEHDVPLPPKIPVNLPPDPSKPKSGGVEPGSYRNTALAMQSASSFIAPIIVLGVGGGWLDTKVHSGGIATVIGFILGFVVGVVSLLRIVNRMNDDPPSKKS